jgi:hypothetical protein
MQFCIILYKYWKVNQHIFFYAVTTLYFEENEKIRYIVRYQTFDTRFLSKNNTECRLKTNIGIYLTLELKTKAIFDNR